MQKYTYLKMKLTKKYAILFFILIAMIKITFHASLANIEVGGGNDSDYYHAYALHKTNFYTSIWPSILRFLADAGLYNRQGLSYVLLFIALLPLPLLYSKVCTNLQSSSSFGYNFDAFVAFSIVALYPTIYYYTFDIYRDIVIYFTFCICILAAQMVLNNKYRLTSFAVFALCCFFAYKLRPYFGFSLATAFVLSFAIQRIKLGIFSLFVLFFVALFLLHTFGLTNSLISYRKSVFTAPAGSNFGIVLDNENSFKFLFLFCYSFALNVFGFSFPNWKAVFAFIVESIPFLIAFVYTIKNYNKTDQFCKFLISFFIIYCTIWCIGNDNLGTALRLRVPAYLAIFASFIIIRRKNIVSQKDNASLGSPLLSSAQKIQ